jgi:hypothetical protein
MIRQAAVCIVLLSGKDDVILGKCALDGEKGDEEARDAGGRVNGGR